MGVYSIVRLSGSSDMSPNERRSTQKRSNPKPDTVGFLFPVVNEYALTVTMEMGHAIPGGAGGNPVFMFTGLQECF